MIAQCWLHIGTEKTGSTSIQSFFAQNRAALLARGWLYPRAAGVRNHYTLVAYSLDDDRRDRTREAFGVGDRVSLHTFRRQLTESLESETDESAAAALVLSNELLATRLRRPDEIVRLKTLCGQIARRTKVVVYLRNQADLLASRYTNVIWEGGTKDFDFRARTAIADYALLLDRWSGVFGKDNLVVRRFEPAEFPGGDVIEDFARVIGLDKSGLRVPRRANPSLDAESLAFLRSVNRSLSTRMAICVQPFRGAIVRALQRRRGGTRFTIPRSLAAKIEDAYRGSNERVAAEYFALRYSPLFSPPTLVSDSPVPKSIGAVAAVRVGGCLAIGLLCDAVSWAGRRLLRRV